VIKEITAKNQSTSWVEVSKSALAHNIKLIKAKIVDDVNLMAVVKANAYGHGDVIVSEAIRKLVDYLGVASVSEAITLRENGITTDILIFAPVQKEELYLYKKHNFTAVIGSFNELNLIDDDISFHIEFDTGMGRLGFYPEESTKVIEFLKQNNLKPAGIMTHFAKADHPNDESVHGQIWVFEGCYKAFNTTFGDLIVHASNSGGTLHYTYPYNMVRCGLSIYGYDPAGIINDLRPVLRWASKVIACKPIKKGMPVSYESTWRASEDGFLVVIPIGYADGIPRNLSNKLQMYCKGKLLQQVGNVTMDYTMLFSSSFVELGSEIEILGPNSMTPVEWAKYNSTIPYEITCGIHPKIKRILVD